MPIKIAVIGKSITNKKFDPLWEELKEAQELNEIVYDTYNLNLNKSVINKNEYDGIIYIATTPVYNEQPAVYLPIQSSEESIINSLNELAEKIKKKLNKQLESKKISAVVEIEGTSIKLLPEEIIQLEKMQIIMDKYGYKILETIIE